MRSGCKMEFVIFPFVSFFLFPTHILLLGPGQGGKPVWWQVLCYTFICIIINLNLWNAFPKYTKIMDEILYMKKLRIRKYNLPRSHDQWLGRTGFESKADSKTVSYKTTFLGIRSNDGKGFLIFFLLP